MLRICASRHFSLRTIAIVCQVPQRVSVRKFSSEGTRPLRNASSIASTSSASSSSIEGLAAQSSDASISLLSSYATYIDQLPQLLHLPPSTHAYAISIVLLTVTLRSIVTLPVTLWQRKRTKRMVDHVVPQWQDLKSTLPQMVAKRCRREKKSYEEYEKELKRELKSQLRRLTAKYNCTPSLTLAVPILVHLPLFISLSLLIRTALMVPGSPISLEVIPWWSAPSELTATFEANAKALAERGFDADSLRMLTSIQGPTLGDADKSMMGPIGLGMLTMGNVELGQWLRRGMASEKDEEEKALRESKSKSIGGQRVIEVGLAPLRAKVMGNTLRAAAIAFVVVSSQAPAGLVVYWLTSGTYTLVQNGIFALLDQKRARAERLDKRKSRP